MTIVRKDPAWDHKALRHYARQFYLKNYRAHRFGAKWGDYLVQIALSLGGGIYAAIQTYQRAQSHDQLSVLLAGVLTLILAVSVLHAASKLSELYFDATDFADEAVLNANSPDEIEDYFDNAYPWVFYHK